LIWKGAANAASGIHGCVSHAAPHSRIVAQDKLHTAARFIDQFEHMFERGHADVEEPFVVLRRSNRRPSLPALHARWFEFSLRHLLRIGFFLEHLGQSVTTLSLTKKTRSFTVATALDFFYVQWRRLGYVATVSH
jgi:hypothetical protein